MSEFKIDNLVEVPCKTCEGCVLIDEEELCDLVDCIPYGRPSFILVAEGNDEED